MKRIIEVERGKEIPSGAKYIRTENKYWYELEEIVRHGFIWDTWATRTYYKKVDIYEVEIGESLD